MDYALHARDMKAAELAVLLTPADPEGRFARASLLEDAGDFAGSARAYEEAASMRPRDYVLWLGLGKVRERSGDAEGALSAFREAARLAPFYAQPRWHLGQALLRAGRDEEAFAELRRAAESDPSLYPNMLRAIWYAAGKEPSALARAAQPRTPEQTLAVVRFLVTEGAGAEGVRLLRESGARLSDDARGRLVSELIEAEDFADAYEIWSEGRTSARGTLADGGFEGGGRLDEGQGFGWRFAREAQGVRLSLDADSPREGAHSLKVEYAGASDPAAPAVSQLVPVEPGARYRLTFSARTKELVTGGSPFVQVVDAAKSGAALASSAPLSPALTNWQDFSVEFDAPRGVGAVRVLLRRQPCASSPCPAFGSVWLDAFELRRL